MRRLWLQKCMTDGLKTSMSSSLTSTLLMEAASYDFGNAETQITTRPGRSCWTGKTIYAGNANNRICSNHFKFGRPTDLDPHSILCLRGYSEQVGIKRKPPADRSVFASAVNCSTHKTCQANCHWNDWNEYSWWKQNFVDGQYGKL